MEEVGAQVATPMFIHPVVGGGLCEPHPMSKKRGLSFMAPNLQQQQMNQRDNWNPKLWDWDNVRFVAKPLDADSVRFGTSAGATSVPFEQLKGNRDEKTAAVNPTTLNKCSVPVEKEDDESLSLKLGGCGGNSMVEEPVSRPNKRVRSGSPNGASNYPMCQVDNCKEDLSCAKDYHRRHKVCELHSKAVKALVGKQMQRFCQQCSRFHPLSEFDEGKRSCRRRLAGHNRRRRKTQPEDVSTQMVTPANHDSNAKANLDLVNLLAVLARTQGSINVKGSNLSSLPNKDQLIQILSKLNSLPLPLPQDLIAKLPASGNLKRNVPDQIPLGNQNRLNASTAPPSTVDLLGVLSATLSASTSDGMEVVSQGSSKASDAKTQHTHPSKTNCLDSQKRPPQGFPSVARERSSSSSQSHCQVQENHSSIPLQLFTPSTTDASLPVLPPGRKYFSSDSSSNPLEDGSPSSSPPVVQKLFPMRTPREPVKPEHIPSSGESSDNVESNGTRGCMTSLDLFGGSKIGGNDHATFQSFQYQAGYTSSSGSDHSPSSMSSDAQDRTGRILFKLFDKDPSQLPGSLRTQIYNWLSHSPLEMESYIRPGCVVLSIYLTMSCSAWEQLEERFSVYVNSLVQISDSDFWRCGKFLLQAGKQLAFHDGKIRFCKSLRSLRFPELISVSPVAVVGGQQTTILLRGRDLSSHATRIHCTHTSDYTVEGIQESVHQGSVYDEISLVGFRIHTASPGTRGRCFVEVDNGLIGSCFPVIIADVTICQELRLLEVELDKDFKKLDAAVMEHGIELERPTSREEVLHFLNELGWLFQRHSTTSFHEQYDYSLGRFKFLLVFSVERDFCSLVKTILGILVERILDNNLLQIESLKMLSEIHLLNRAVQRRSKRMIDLLINYSVHDKDRNLRKYVFLPDLAGPGGITALHLVACLPSSDDIVDAITNDPQEIGLHCWTSLPDGSGLSPFAYALMRNNQSYNMLVAKKLSDRKNHQVSVSIESEIEQQCTRVEEDQSRPTVEIERVKRPCSKCSIVAARYNGRITGSRSLLHGPLIHSMLAVAAVCVCVCLFLRGSPNIGLGAPFKWENLDYGAL